MDAAGGGLSCSPSEGYDIDEGPADIGKLARSNEPARRDLLLPSLLLQLTQLALSQMPSTALRLQLACTKSQ